MASFDLRKLEKVNDYARKSCRAWNRIGPSRRHNRNLYRDAALDYYNSKQHQ